MRLLLHRILLLNAPSVPIASLVALLLTFFPAFGAEPSVRYAPAISDFAITFSSKPKVSEFETVGADGGTIKASRAELSLSDSFERVEVAAMPVGFSSAVTKESAIASMKQYALHNGLRSPEFTWEVTALGKRLTMRATKLLDDKGKSRAATYEAVALYGRSSIFMIYVGGPSTSYPQTSIVKFLASVKKNEK